VALFVGSGADAEVQFGTLSAVDPQTDTVWIMCGTGNPTGDWLGDHRGAIFFPRSIEFVD
jgi:hypothetical protein